MLAVQYMYMRTTGSVGASLVPACMYVQALARAELVPTLTGRAQANARPSIVHPQEPTCIKALSPGRKISYSKRQRSAARRQPRRRGHSVRAVVGRAQRTRRLHWFLHQEPNRNNNGVCRSFVSSERIGLGGYEALIGASTPSTAALI